MDTFSLQLITLAAAYVLAVGLGAVQVTLTVLNWRSSKRVEARRSVETRLTTLENQQANLEDLVRTFNGREAKRRRTAKKREQEEEGGDDAPQQLELDRDARLAEWQSQRSRAS